MLNTLTINNEVRKFEIQYSTIMYSSEKAQSIT